MTESAKMGLNRTGVQMSPKDSPEMKKIAEETGADVPGDAGELARERAAYVSGAERIGSVPLPGTAKGAVKTGIEKMTGKNPEVFLDKLGQRLAFERSGVRLYEALLAKAEGLNLPHEIRAKLEHFKKEEAEHMQIVKECMETLGADPTAMTPCADVAGVSAIGPLQVLTDPRTNFAQSLDAMLTIELTDNAAWELLIELAEKLGQEEMATRFRHALTQEEHHLETVKSWLSGQMAEQLA